MKKKKLIFLFNYKLKKLTSTTLSVSHSGSRKNSLKEIENLSKKLHFVVFLKIFFSKHVF